jgi:acetylornithine aminotransferase
MSKTSEIIERGNKALIANYARLPVVMARGEGAYLWDVEGKRYLDLFAGFGGAILGHSHPELIAAITEQAQRLWHVGNTFHTQPQIELAERLNRHAFAGQAFFCHSGAEANEAACKLARLRGVAELSSKFKIISLEHSFHGRTLAMISATGNAAVRAGFGPEVAGFIRVEAGDFDALALAANEDVCAILFEPIQGEGGINFHPDGYVQRVRDLCDRKSITLIFDEVWTGCGRTGKWFGHQHVTDSQGKVVEPDIMTLGKAIGGGLPVGVMYAKPSLAAILVPGKHGCTLGGNPICMSAARAVFDVIEKQELLTHAAAMGEHAIARLRNESSIRAKVAGIRGRGLFLGVELKEPPAQLVERGLERGVIVNLTAKKVIRLAPPINITYEQWDAGLDAVVNLIASL